MGLPVLLRVCAKYSMLLAICWCAVTVADQCEQPDAQISFVQRKAQKLSRVVGASVFKNTVGATSSDPSCLQEEQKQHLLDRIHNNTSLNVLVDGLDSHVDAKINQPNATGGILWVSYHKSGEELMFQLRKLLAPFIGASTGRSSPPEEWTVPDNIQVVYAFRDPIKLLLSAYRYHAAGREPSWENLTEPVPYAKDAGTVMNVDPVKGVKIKGEQRRTPCLYCAEADSELLFSACLNKSNNYSYLDLLSSYPEEAGILVEFIRARKQLQVMQRNLQKWMNDRNTLVLTIEHFEADFNQTATCLLRFFGYKDDVQGYSLALSHLQAADIHSASFHSPVTTQAQHLTGGRYDNTKLENILREHPILGPQFAGIRSVAEVIYQRQFKMYGCPTPSL